MSIRCDETYPEKPPVIKFNSKINLPCIDQSNGNVIVSKFSLFANWSPSYTLEKVLIGLKNEMITHKKVAQPADGDMFWAWRWPLPSSLLTARPSDSVSASTHNVYDRFCNVNENAYNSNTSCFTLDIAILPLVSDLFRVIIVNKASKADSETTGGSV